MVKVTAGDKELYLDGYLKENLDLAKKVIEKDWDMVFVVDGYEGGGKSVLAQQIAKYLDPSLDMSRIAFSPEEFREAIINAKKHQAVIYDEAYGGFASRQAMSFVNKALVSMMSQIRQKNLFVLVVLPCFFELDKYIALWRSRALIHVYTGENFQRGFFSFYSANKKKEMYVLGKKTYKYCMRPDFRGRFTKGYAVNEEEYRKQKLEALSVNDCLGELDTPQRDSIIAVLIEKGWEHKEIAEALSKYSSKPITRSGITKVINRLKDRGVIQDEDTTAQ